MSARQEHFPFLDAFRGLAILFVMLYHSYGHACRFKFGVINSWIKGGNQWQDFGALYLIATGAIGVAVFFALSGFCIHHSYLNLEGEKRWNRFFARRFFRIYPPYLLALAFFVALDIEGGSFLERVWSWSAIEHVLLIHNLYNASIFSFNGSFWSIAVEVQLYLMFPLLVFMASNASWRLALLITACFEVGLRSMDSVAGSGIYPTMIGMPLLYWFSWSIGAWLASAYRDNRRTIFSKFRFDLSAVVFLVFPLSPLLRVYTFPAASILTVMAMARFIDGTWTVPQSGIALRIWRHLVSLGLVSYSFYLLHEPILQKVVYTIQEWYPALRHTYAGVAALSLFSYPLIFGIAWLFFRLVEVPSKAFGRAVEKGIGSELAQE
jgi:peptidoglycan/LPS O-acetylase OafA/YrhL